MSTATSRETEMEQDPTGVSNEKQEERASWALDRRLAVTNVIKIRRRLCLQASELCTQTEKGGEKPEKERERESDAWCLLRRFTFVSV